MSLGIGVPKLNPIWVVLVLLTMSLGGCSTGWQPIVFAGRVVNEESGEWPNNRLVLLFLKEQEVGRDITHTGKYESSWLGVHDGLFVIPVENTYELSWSNLNESSEQGIFFTEQTYDSSSVMAHWFNELSEGATVVIPIPSKNIKYTLKVLEGDVSTLPEALLSPGSTRLRKDGVLVVAQADGSSPSSSFTGADGVQLSITSSVNTENLILNKITVPINNCGGSGRVTQRYTQSQTFVHEYTSEVSGGVGIELGVPWAKLLVELQSKYGFEQGQVDSRTADTTLEVEPGTNQVFVIVWSEVWDSGTATVMAGNDRIEAPFRVKKDVIYSIDSQKLECP